MQSEAEPETPNPHTGRETGLNNLSRGPGETAHRSPAGGTRRDVRARPTQGRVALYNLPIINLIHKHMLGKCMGKKAAAMKQGAAHRRVMKNRMQRAILQCSTQ
jgi:hypothetical protein